VDRVRGVGAGRRRARAHLGLLLLVLAQVALTTAAVAGATAYVSLAERDGVRDALAAAVDDLDDDGDVDVAGLTTQGDLPATLAALEARLGGVRGVTTAAVLLVVLTGVIALSQMARLLADARLPETVLLRSRGTSVGQVTAASLVEAAVVGVVGAALGAGLAWAVPVVTGVGHPPLGGILASAGAAAVVSAVVLAARARSHAVGVVRRGRSDAAGRNVRAARAGVAAATCSSRRSGATASTSRSATPPGCASPAWTSRCSSRARRRVVPGTGAARRTVVPGATAPDDARDLAALADLAAVNRALLLGAEDVAAGGSTSWPRSSPCSTRWGGCSWRTSSSRRSTCATASGSGWRRTT
jgi:hypothetical protein